MCTIVCKIRMFRLGAVHRLKFVSIVLSNVTY
jgi:hypothetical protein